MKIPKAAKNSVVPTMLLLLVGCGSSISGISQGPASYAPNFDVKLLEGSWIEKEAVITDASRGKYSP
jgi:hypothetical protein